MSSQTVLAFLILLLSLPMGVGGALVTRNAYAMRPPTEPERRTLTGNVVEIVTEICGTHNRRSTCYRPVVDYDDGGEQKQIVSRAAYRTQSPLRKGESVPVLVAVDGAAWIGFEWDDHQADRTRQFTSTRRSRLVMGSVVAGCGAFGMLLAFGLMFWVDRSGEKSP